MQIAREQGSKIPKSNRIVSVAGSTLPIVMLQDKSQYSVVVNLFGVEPKDVFIDVNAPKHELGIYAGKSTKENKSASFWVFGVPRDGILRHAKVVYKGGGLQITVPRLRTTQALAA